MPVEDKSPTQGVLNCIVTYNRPYYLKNAVDSVREFLPGGDLLIVDDGSDDPVQVNLLLQLERAGETILRQDRKLASGVHGGLYRAMNQAVQFARERGFEYLHFIQDDMQFMWRDPQVYSKVSGIFEAFEDALQASLVFFKGIVPNMSERVDLLPDQCCYRLRGHGLVDTGVVHLGRLKDVELPFRVSETETTQDFCRRGFRVYVLHSPVLAWIPWPVTFAFGRKSGTLRLPRNRYYLEPLTAGQISRLNSRPLEELPYHENYCFPWGWGCWTPYWFTNFVWREYKTCILHSFKMGSPVVPGWRHGERTGMRAALRSLYQAFLCR